MTGVKKDTPLEVEVVAHVLGSMDHCSHCQVFIDGVGVGEQIHRFDLDSYPRDWMDEWQSLSDLILSLAERFGNQVVIRITDAQSPKGLWLALRGVRKYPTFIVQGQRVHGMDEQIVTRLIEQDL